MTSVSIIAPYAPQPISGANADGHASLTFATPPVSSTKASGFSNDASGHTGHGARNATGLGDTLTSLLRADAQNEASVSNATQESVVAAQSKVEQTADFLAQQQAEKAMVRDRANALADAQMKQQQELRDQQAEAAARATEFKMPDPLPTAPILRTEPN